VIERKSFAARLLLMWVVLAFPLLLSAQSRRRSVEQPSAPPTARSFAPDRLEAYLTENAIAYIRPGLKIKVNSITIGSDRKPVVDVSFTDDFDQPVDRLGKTTPGPISASFILASWDPVARHYTSYTIRNVTTPANSPRPGVKAIQAAPDAGGTWEDLETGHAKYRFATVLPAGFDQTKTHTLGFQAFRNLTNIPSVELGKNYYANLEHDFRPDGQKVTDTWGKINDTTSCLACHDKETFGFHGSSARRDVKLCVLCHQPQTVDPDTGHTMDLKVMIHKIHAPGELSAPYIIYGNAQSVHNYSGVTYPQDLRNCDNCHEGIDATKKPAQSDAWYTKPNREACGSCHDDINWVTGAKHAAGAQLNDNACASCHQPESALEFDASIKARAGCDMALRAVAAIARIDDLVVVVPRIAEAEDGEVLRQLVAGVDAMDHALERHGLRRTRIRGTTRLIALDRIVADHTFLDGQPLSTVECQPIVTRVALRHRDRGPPRRDRSRHSHVQDRVDGRLAKRDIGTAVSPLQS